MFLTSLLLRERLLGLHPLLLQQAILRLQLGQPRLELPEPAARGRHAPQPLGGSLAQAAQGLVRTLQSATKPI